MDREVQAPYDRLPARAEKTVSPDVWNLSHNSAGLYIKFKTNAEELIIRYVVKGLLQYPKCLLQGPAG